MIVRKGIKRVIEKDYSCKSNPGDIDLADSYKLVLDRTSISEFDKNGNSLRNCTEHFFTENGNSEELISKDVILYSDDNRLLQQLSYNFDSKLNSIEEYIYDEKNCLSGIIILNSDSFIQDYPCFLE